MEFQNKITFAHKVRMDMLEAVRNADVVNGEELQKQYVSLLKSTEMGIMSRADRLRSLKNIVLSYNTLYSYFAEQGGLSPVIAHYKAERYAIMVERAQTEEEVWNIYHEYFSDYIDGNARVLTTSEQSLSAQVQELISKRFTNRLSIAAIARVLHIRPEHLMRSFKKETGTTIQRVIMEKRMNEACRLLANSNLTLTEIAMMTGFNSSSYFSSAFRQTLELSPSDYREYMKHHYG